MGCYVMVGLASRRILLHPTTDHMVAQVFRLQQPHGGETSIRVRRETAKLLQKRRECALNLGFPGDRGPVCVDGSVTGSR